MWPQNPAVPPSSSVTCSTPRVLHVGYPARGTSHFKTEAVCNSWLKPAIRHWHRLLTPSLIKLNYMNRKMQKMDLPSPWTIFQFSHTSKLFSHARAVIFLQWFLCKDKISVTFPICLHQMVAKNFLLEQLSDTLSQTWPGGQEFCSSILFNYSYTVMLIPICLRSKDLSALVLNPALILLKLMSNKRDISIENSDGQQISKAAAEDWQEIPAH